ncbi:MAG: hypothetical protein Q9193_004689 [Seirophora villosa]
MNIEMHVRDGEAIDRSKNASSELAPTAIISYSLGLRHAIDADHIAIIDLVTRRLVASGQKPVAVGTFFSLGHSTLHSLVPNSRTQSHKSSIVIITSIVVAATAAAISSKFGTFERVGGIIGTSVSAAVLILLAIANAYILWKLVQQMRSYLTKPAEDLQHAIQGRGCMFGLLRKMFNLMDRSILENVSSGGSVRRWVRHILGQVFLYLSPPSFPARPPPWRFLLSSGFLFFPTPGLPVVE